MKKKTALVTGGAGFIGSNLVKRLQLENYDIVVVDNYSAGKKENEIPGVLYIREHTKNIKSIDLPLFLQFKEQFKPDIVYHLGEYSRIHPSFQEYSLVWQYNTVGTFEVLDYCKQHNIKIVYAASSTRFAKEGVSHSPYSLTKAMSVDLVKAFAQWYGTKYAICYFYNVFGPGYDSSPVPGYESVISVFEKQYRAGKPLTVAGDGRQERMFTYVGDVVEGLIKAADYPENDEFDLVNPNRSYSILEIARMFSNNIEFTEARKGDRTSSIAPCYDETCKKLNWTPTVTVEEWISNIKH